MAAKKKSAPKAKAKTRRGVKLAPSAVKRGLSATEVALPLDHVDLAEVVAMVTKAGGAPLGAYREPLGGRPLLLASLPFSAVQPTPFQRDLSPTHAKRLAGAIEATAAFLDPLIVVRGEDGRFWTPNGRHRLAAAKMLGLKQLTVLISPDETLSYRILALNTEKAHNLKDKSLEVVRMARNLAKREPSRTEASLAAEFEAAELLTLGLVYEDNLRFGGGAYSPVLKKVDRLTTKPLPAALREREAYAKRLAEIDAQEQARGSGAREKPQQDRAYDIAASLDALESLDYGKPAEGFANEDEQIDVEEVFQKFKEGVEKQISVDDSDSHYNLGIAYKEMMLIDDAIREFDVAARDPKRECVCRSMIGMLEIERGRVNEAIEAFKAGLNAPNKDPQQETVLCYELGAAYEFKKQNKDALSYFQKAMRRDPNYRDVQERVRRLAKAEQGAPPRQAAVGADDEFDRAFDDLLAK